MKMNRFAIIFSLFLVFNLSLNAQQSIDNKVAELLSKMTLEEKIGQMNQYNGLKKSLNIFKHVVGRTIFN